MEKQFVYIVQAALEQGKCKIGITDNLARRLKDYNRMSGKSKDNQYRYIFSCEVKDMRKVENDMKKEFKIFREATSTEIFLYNTAVFERYVAFIRNHAAFVGEVFIKPPSKKTVVKIVKKTTPSLQERGMSRKDVMQKAKQADDNEFYTQYKDVKKEVEMHDPELWKDKVVFCNCDDAFDDDRKNSSVFTLYFLDNFVRLGLKKLICTHYSGKIDLFNQGPKGYVFTKDGFTEKKDFPSGYTGSFDDPLSLKILNDEADIVCTNPPFSRAIDYWKILIASGKKFLIISGISNTINTAYIPYFKNGKIWAGYNRVDKYLNPKRELVDASGHWYTNFIVKDRPKYKRLKIMPLKDIPEKQKAYDDAKTLLVDGCHIPNDYDKPFAVSARPILNGILEKGYEIVQEKRYTPYINSKEKFARVLIKKSEPVCNF